MLTTNLQNMIESRPITTDYFKEYVDSDTYVRRFMDINEFKMIEVQAQGTYKDIIHLYNMGIMTINNMWDYVLNDFIDLTLEKAITVFVVDMYTYNNGIDYLFQHIYLDGVNIPNINNNKNLHGYLLSNYSSIVIDTGVDDYVYNNTRLVDAIESILSSIYPSFDAEDFLAYILESELFNKSIETRIDLTPGILKTQNHLIEKYLKYSNYLEMYKIIDPDNNLIENIDEIASIIHTISSGQSLDLSMESKIGYQFLADGISVKEFDSYDTSHDLISHFKNIALDFQLRYSFEDVGDDKTKLAFSAADPYILHISKNTTNNEDELLDPIYIESLFKMLPTISNLNQALVVTKEAIKNKFSGVITNAFRQLAGISDPEALRLLNNEVLTFVGPNLVNPVSTNLIITEEAIEEYLVNMKQDLLFDPINDFMETLQNKLQGISTINEVWNINLLETFMEGAIPLIKSTPDAYKVTNDVIQLISLKIIEEFAKITNSEGILLIKRIDVDLKMALNAYLCQGILVDINDTVMEFALDYLEDLAPMLEINQFVEDEFKNRVIIEDVMENVISKIILPTFIQFIFGTRLSKSNSRQVVRYGSFTALNKDTVQYANLMSSVLNNDVTTITDINFLSTDALTLLNENVQTTNYTKFNNQMQYIDTSSPDVIINYQNQIYYIAEASEYANRVKPVLNNLGMVEVNYKIKPDLNLTIANRLKICSSDVFRKNMDPIHTGTTALISMFIEYSPRLNRYAFRPEAKKYFPDSYLREVNNLFFVDVETGLGYSSAFGSSYNLYLLNTDLNSVLFSRSCDFSKYVINKPIIKLKNKDYVLLVDDAIELYNGSTYLFNSHKATFASNETLNQLILNAFKLNRSLLDDITLDVIDRDHRDLNLNVDAYEKYLALKYLINADIQNALNTTNLLSSLYTIEIETQLEVSTEYKIFHDMYGIHRS